MHDSYQLTVWETPVSHADMLDSISLAHSPNGNLTFAVTDIAKPSPIYLFTFQAITFKVSQESYMLALWGSLAWRECDSATAIVEHSPWVRELVELESLIAHDAETMPLMHYIIATSTVVLEVLAVQFPLIETQS